MNDLFMDVRFLSLKLDLRIIPDKADAIVKSAANNSIHSYEALQIFGDGNGTAGACLRYILSRDYLIDTTYHEDQITADTEIYPIWEEPWPGIEFIDFLKSISPAIAAGSRAEFLMLGHTIMSIHFIGSALSVWTPREPITHWDVTHI